MINLMHEQLMAVEACS